MNDWRLSDFSEEYGQWTGPDGAVYGDDAMEAVHIGILEFCGCGSPEASMRYVRDGLRLIAEKSPSGPGEHDAWKEWYAEHRQRVDNHYNGSPGAEYFFYYWCDSLDLIEHGGSVPGWLSAKGEGLLADIEQALGDEGVGVEVQP